MSSWSGRVCALALALVVVCGLGATACGGDGSGSAPDRPDRNGAIADHAADAALAAVEHEFAGCGDLGIDIMGGSTVVRSDTAEEMLSLRELPGPSAQGRSARASLVVVLREFDMFVAGPGRGQRAPVGFNRPAEVMLREARAADDGCGASASARYTYTPPDSS